MDNKKHSIDALLVRGQKSFVKERDFQTVFRKSIAQLDAMLHLNLQKMVFERHYKGPIGMQLKEVRRYDTMGKYALRDWEAYRLGLLTMDLMLLQKEKRPVFNQFKKLLLKSTQNEYFGLRFEISTAADLQRSAFNFVKRERPDFEVSTKAGNAYIECVNANLANTKSGDLIYKIIQAIEKKERKGYGNLEQTVLFVDFTNVHFHSSKAGTPLSFDSMENQIKDALTKSKSKSKFGAVAALALLPAIDGNAFLVGGRVCRNLAASESLSYFLDSFFTDIESVVKHGVSFSF